MFHRLARTSAVGLALALAVTGCGDDEDQRTEGGITVTPTSGLTTTETGGDDSFTIQLDSRPRSNVTIALSSDDDTEGRVNPEMLTFTESNWNAPQRVTVTGLDDEEMDGSVEYSIITAPAVSDDSSYNDLNAADVKVTNIDNETAGVTVDADEGLMTTEAGGTASFSVVLNAAPTADVTIPVSTSDATEGTVEAASLTFTTDNWSAPQQVTVTGVDDAEQDGNVEYTINLGVIESDDETYAGIDPVDVTLINVDDETAGVTITPTEMLTTTEEGGTAMFSIVLNAAPTSDVTITLMSSDDSEGTVAPQSLTFTADNWNAPQDVLVTGVDDDEIDGDQMYSIIMSAESDDGAYSGVEIPDVTVINVDDDQGGFLIEPLEGLVVSEDETTTATFTIRLTTQPTADVTVGLSSNAPDEATIDLMQVVFTTDNWNSEQVVTVTGVDDMILDGDQPFTIITAPATSDDPNYSDVDPANVTGINQDNDTAGINVTPTEGLRTTEAGGTATFEVVLRTMPTADVMIALSSSDPDEGTVAPDMLTFTPVNWAAPQMVTVTGVADDLVDGNQRYTIITAAATSDDANYAGINPADVNVINEDIDAGVLLNVTEVQTAEQGPQATFSVSLNTAPTADVVVTVTSGDTSEGTVTPTTLTFTPANFAAPQVVTVTPVDDDIADGPQVYQVTLSAASADDDYDGIVIASVEVTNVDNETAGFAITPAATETLETTEAGGTATFTMRLTSQPSANVTVALSSDDTTEGTVAPASLTFTMANWNAPQTVTVTGVNDMDADGNVIYNIVTAAATSMDMSYAGLNPRDVRVRNIDDETPGITVTPRSVTVSETGTTQQIAYRLNARPTANVTINLTLNPPDGEEISINPTTLTFTPLNWRSFQQVTVTGLDDDIADNAPITVVGGRTQSTSAPYDDLVVPGVTVRVTDNDTAGVVVDPTMGLTTSELGGSATFSVVLTSEPTANVTIPITSSDTTEGVPQVMQLVFTPANWNAPQNVTVDGRNDDVADGDQVYFIRTGAAVSTDAGYSGFNADDVTLTNVDDETAGFEVTPLGGLNTTERGGTDTFRVRLTSEPTANVTVPVSSNDTGEGTAAPTSLVFTPQNWNAFQTVTVTGVDDDVADGPQTFTVVLAPAMSGDAGYNGMDPPNVVVTNADNETAGVFVDPTDGLVVTEDGTVSATFSIVLRSRPSANVTIPLTVSDASEATLGGASPVVFTPANWNAPQFVSVTGLDDDVADGNQVFTVVTGTTMSGDMQYNGLNVNDVEITNIDDETAGILVSRRRGLVTNESGSVTDSFSVVLTSQPTGNVTIPLTVSDPSEASLNVANLVFTMANWNTPQTVIVTGVNDALVDGDQTYLVRLEAAMAGGGDAYNGLIGGTVEGTNLDDETAGVLATPRDGLITSEANGTDTFEVVLNAQPAGNVTIALSSSNTSEGTVSPMTLNFTPGNWNVSQTVTITGVDDGAADGNQTYLIIGNSSTSADADYAALPNFQVEVVNTDND